LFLIPTQIPFYPAALSLLLVLSIIHTQRILMLRRLAIILQHSKYLLLLSNSGKTSVIAFKRLQLTLVAKNSLNQSITFHNEIMTSRPYGNQFL